MTADVFLSKKRLQAPVADLTALENIDVTGVADGVGVIVNGVGLFVWDGTETTPDDGVLVIWPSTHPASGRWLKQTDKINEYLDYEQYNIDDHLILTNPCPNAISIVASADNLNVFLPILLQSTINAKDFGEFIALRNDGLAFTLKDSNAATQQIVDYGDVLLCTPTSKNTTQGSWMIITLAQIGYTFSGLSALNSTDLQFPYSQYNEVEFTQAGQKLYLSNAQLMPANRINMPVQIYNSGAFAFDIAAVDTTTVIYSKLMPGETVILRCTSQLTTNGTWDVAQVILSNTPSTNPQTGTTYTFTAADFKGNVTVTANNASTQTYTLPQTSTTAIPAGRQVTIINKGTGTVNFVGEGSDSILPGGIYLAPGASAIIEKEVAGSPNTYRIIGGTKDVAVKFSIGPFNPGVSKTYSLAYAMQQVCTLNQVNWRADTFSAGSFTAKLSGTNITGGTVAAAVGPSSQALTASNVSANGNDLQVVFDASIVATNLFIEIQGTMQVSA